MKKSVYLFSVAVLGISLCPSSVFADEAAESPAPEVTTEFVESPINNENEASESEESVQEIPTGESKEEVMEERSQELEPTNETVPENTLEQEPPEVPKTAAPGELASAEEPLDLQPEEPILEASEVEPPKVETPQAQPKVAAFETTKMKAITPTLKEENEGKIVDHEKTITDENATIDSEYNFMPKFDDLEGIVVGGTKDYVEAMTSFQFDLTKAQFNTITVTYQNVGTYKGKVVDMKVTVKDWTVLAGSPYSTSKVHIHKGNGITMYGISDIRMNYAFIDRLTGNALTLSGFFNFTDIDLNQSIDLFNPNALENFYVTKGNALYYKVRDHYIKIGEIEGKNTTESDMDHWLTYTYKNISNFDVRYNQDYETGAVFRYTYQAPVVIEELPPFELQEPEKPQELEKPDVVQDERPEEKAPEKPEAPKIVVKEPAKLISLIKQVPVLTYTKTVTSPMKTKIVTETKPVFQTENTVLPKTNEKKASIFTTLGGAGLVLLSGIFLKKKNEKK